MLTKTVKF